MKKFFVIFACLCSAFLILLLLIVAFPKPLVNLYAGYIEKKLNVDIDFSSDRFLLSKEWHFSDVRILSKTGYTLNIKDLTLSPPLFSLLKGEMSTSCKAEDVRFYKELPLLDAVFRLLSIERLAKMTFDVIEVHIALKQNRVDMNDLRAVSKDMKVFGTGTVDTKKSLIDYRLDFLFSEEITKNIPDVIKFTMLKKKDAGWMGLSLNVSGDYRRPYLKLDSDFLNLNIKGIRIK